MDDDKEKEAGTPGESEPRELTINASDEADAFAIRMIDSTPQHPWHGFECRTCLNRYVVLVTSFDAGYQCGLEQAFQKLNSGIGVPGGIPIIGQPRGG